MPSLPPHTSMRWSWTPSSHSINMVYYIDFHVLNQHYIHPINLTWSSCMCCAVLSHSVVPNFVQPHGLWPVQAPLFMGFLRQEYWSELPFPSPEDLPNPGSESISPESPALAGRCFTTWETWYTQYVELKRESGKMKIQRNVVQTKE